MTEARRYLRYSLPGLVSLLMLASLYLISDYCGTLEFTRKWKLEGMWAGVLALIASVALGYVLAQFNHTIYWLIPRSERSPVGNFTLFTDLVGDKFKVVDQDDKDVTLKDLSKWKTIQRRHTWIIMNSAMNCELHEHYKNTKDWIAVLVDNTHAVGTTLLGIVLSFCLWLLTADNLFKDPDDYWALSVFVIVSLLLVRLYLMNLTTVEITANTAVLSAINKQYEKENRGIRPAYWQPVKLHYYRIRKKRDQP